MSEKTIKELAVDLTVEMTEMCDRIKTRSVYVDQLLRASASIGADIHEAKYAHSRTAFISRMEVALKECHETEYWLEILYKVHAISENRYNYLNGKCGTIRHGLTAAISAAKNGADK